MKFFKGSRNERQLVRIRYVFFLAGAILGMAFGMSFQKLYAWDENGDAVCLAKNIYFEAGNQPLAGKVAVAQVVLNRIDHSSYPDDICGVVYQAKEYYTSWTGNVIPKRGMCQFSWYCDGRSDEPLDTKTWLASYKVANDVILGKYLDITEGATHYHADYIYPYWAESLNETVLINNHIFYK
tara:strand:- start:53 stop:598 length:546 start_codon:yes stop_codon:yes gene_type:complete